jgi:hypothetical protein
LHLGEYPKMLAVSGKRLVQNCITNTISVHTVLYLCTLKIAVVDKTPLYNLALVFRGRVISRDFLGGEGGEIRYVVFYHIHMKHSNYAYTFI